VHSRNTSRAMRRLAATLAAPPRHSVCTSSHVSALPRFLLLYGLMYAAFGVASPFLPAFLHSRGAPAEALGAIVAGGTLIRLVAAPLAGRLGDRLHALRLVLLASALAAALITPGYLWMHGTAMLAALYLAQAAALAPTAVLADALAIGRSFEYGWVRGAGSAAFVVGTLVSGQAVGAFGLVTIVWLQALLLAAEAVAAYRVPERPRFLSAGKAAPAKGSMMLLLRLAPFRTLVLAAALVLGSHAMHDAFAVIRWSDAGIGAATTSVLWSEAVAAEVLVFFFFGPALVTRLTPGGAIALAALAGVLRWGVMAQSASVLAAALVQPLHGVTFALLHLACMRLIARTVPAGLEGTAQAIYGTVGVGAASAALTLASGLLYGRFGPAAFWAMGALCALALPLGLKLTRA
jgi:MFS transporter, PPP family, 3-phenylpropionic acid transporter